MSYTQTTKRSAANASSASKDADETENKMVTQKEDEFEKQKNEEIKEVFDLFDVEQKGLIQGANMKICLKTLGIDIKKKELEPILHEEFKKGLDDYYKFEQFLKVAKKKIAEKKPEDELKKEFYFLCDCKEDDENMKNKINTGNIVLTKESLMELAEKVGETMSKEEIDEMIEIVGCGKGQITMNDFVAFMRNPLEYNMHIRSFKD